MHATWYDWWYFDRFGSLKDNDTSYWFTSEKLNIDSDSCEHEAIFSKRNVDILNICVRLALMSVVEPSLYKVDFKVFREKHSHRNVYGANWAFRAERYWKTGDYEIWTRLRSRYHWILFEVLQTRACFYNPMLTLMYCSTDACTSGTKSTAPQDPAHLTRHSAAPVRTRQQKALERFLYGLEHEAKTGIFPDRVV